MKFRLSCSSTTEEQAPDISRLNMSESPEISDASISGGETSEVEDLLPAFETESVETANVKPTVLFPQRRTSLEKITKTRKQYSEMVEIALFQMNETRTGSSRQAIVKYIRANYQVGDNANRYVSLAIAKLIEKERIVRKTGVGASGSFSLPKEIREAMRKGVNVKPKAKPKPKPKSKAATKETKKTTTNKTKVEGAKGGKSKTKAKADEEGGDSDKENEPVKADKATKKNAGAKASSGRAKKEQSEAGSKATNKKTKAENEDGKGKGKASEKATKPSKTTASKAKPKPSAKEVKESQPSKAKGKAEGKAPAKPKGKEKEASGAPSKKSAQTKNTKKNEDKPVRQRTKS